MYLLAYLILCVSGGGASRQLTAAAGGHDDDDDDDYIDNDVDKPIFRPAPTNITVSPGDRASLKCRVDNLGTKTVRLLYMHCTARIRNINSSATTAEKLRGIKVCVPTPGRLRPAPGQRPG